jgi:hypothetical protein
MFIKKVFAFEIKTLNSREDVNMAMTNAKAIRNTIRIFVKENGREPTFEESRELLAGRSLSKKNIQDKQEEVK